MLASVERCWRQQFLLVMCDREPCASSPFSGVRQSSTTQPCASSPFSGVRQSSTTQPCASSPFSGVRQSSTTQPCASSPFRWEEGGHSLWMYPHPPTPHLRGWLLSSLTRPPHSRALSLSLPLTWHDGTHQHQHQHRPSPHLERLLQH
jgi:hypothetical protein